MDPRPSPVACPAACLFVSPPISLPSLVSVQPPPRTAPHPRRHTILVFGDPQGTFPHVVESVPAPGPQARALLGSILARQPLQAEVRPIAVLTEVWFIDGPHGKESEPFPDRPVEGGVHVKL
jgi:hypothetical protein